MVPAILAGVAALGSAAGTYFGNKYAADKAAQSRERAAKEIARMQGESDKYYQTMINGITDYYKNRGGLGTATDVQNYKKAIGAYDPNAYVLDMTDPNNQFGYKKTADDFVNPYMDRIINDTAQTVQHTAAGSGLGRGSGAAASIADAIVKKNEELYNDAYNRFTDDRQFEYNKYADYITNRQNQLKQLQSANDTKLQLQGNLANDYFNVMDARQADLIRAQQDRQGTMATYAQAMMGVA